MSKDFPDKLNLPGGFKFAAMAAGIKPSGKPDLAIAVCSEGATAAAVFTKNLVVAAPVTVGRANLHKGKGKVKAVIVNAGNANCATGAEGLKAANLVCQNAAKQLRTKAEHIFPSSTGIIGVPLPVEKITRALSEVLKSARSGIEAFECFARAIMTTDTRHKVASAIIRSGKNEIRIVGAAKGAGMIHPNLATMLVYIFTDAIATPVELRKSLNAVVNKSFNNISVDGDTSTNDTVLLLASGAGRVKLRSKTTEKKFRAALQEVCYSLAHQIVSDGEGVQHVIHLHVEQSASKSEARQAARTMATSTLLKTAWAGCDPNWGRILAALGRSGVRFNPMKINVFIGPHQVCKNGGAAKFDQNVVHRYMQQPEYEIHVQLGKGNTSLEFLTCDLTEEYVKINAEYST